MFNVWGANEYMKPTPVQVAGEEFAVVNDRNNMNASCRGSRPFLALVGGRCNKSVHIVSFCDFVQAVIFVPSRSFKCTRWL